VPAPSEDWEKNALALIQGEGKKTKEISKKGRDVDCLRAQSWKRLHKESRKKAAGRWDLEKKEPKAGASFLLTQEVRVVAVRKKGSATRSERKGNQKRRKGL